MAHENFWFDSFFTSSCTTLEDGCLNGDNSVSFSGSWLGLLDAMSNLLDDVEGIVVSVKCDPYDTSQRRELGRSLLQLSEISQTLQRFKSQQSSGVLSDGSTGCRMAGYLSEERAGNFKVVDERLEGYDGKKTLLWVSVIGL